MKKILAHLRRDPVMAAALTLAVLSAFFVPPSAAYIGYIDWRVLGLLLSLMLVVAGLQRVGVFAFLVERLLKLVRNTRALSAVLIGVCFFSSMLITNDVALITFVPLAVMTLGQTGKRKLFIPVIVLQTVAANLGSMLTPLGNPQNLYLYALSGMSVGAFLRVMALPTVLSFLLLTGAVLLIRAEKIELSPNAEETQVQGKKVMPWALLFVLCLLSVCHVLHWALVLAVVAAATWVMDRPVLRRADYGLLLTFIFFFVFIGNMKEIPVIRETLSGLVAGRELTAGVLLSQVISNVPAAMLLSGFTTAYEELLIGVNLGGLGTIIASMASLISYKIYTGSVDARSGPYMKVFTGVNLLFLALLWGAMALLG